MTKENHINPNQTSSKILPLLVVSLLIIVLPGSVDATNYSLTRQGDDVTGAVGPATTLCLLTTPSGCSPSHFDSGTSAHIGRHDYSSSSDPWAKYHIIVNDSPYCIDEDNLRIELRYQLNDVWHGLGADHDAYIKLRDWGQTAETHDLLDSTVNTQTSSVTYGGTLDGSNTTGYASHGTSFFTGTTRSFSKTSISATSETGTYVTSYGSSGTQSKVGLYISTNPGSAPGFGAAQTRIEVDWIKVQYGDEDTAPINPSSPQFYWEDSTMPGGPTTSGWYNSLGSKVEVRFGSGGYDACDFQHVEYMWRLSSSSDPSTYTSGTTVQSDNSANSIFSDIIAPSTSGSYKFWWRAVDGFGNKANWASSGIIDFDYTNPNLPPPTSDSSWYNATSSPSLYWSAASDTYSGMNEYSLQQDGVGSIGDVTHTAGTASYTYPISTSSLNTGSNSFQITAKDLTIPSPNTHTRSLQIMYDPNNPPVNNNPLVNNTLFTNSAPLIQWTSVIAYDAPSESGLNDCAIIVDGSQVSTISESTCSSSSGTITLPALADGPHTLAITACDLVNNCNYGNPRSFTVDATPPSLEEVTISPSSTSWVNSSYVSVNAVFSDQSIWGNGSGIDRIWYGFFIDGYSPSQGEVKSANSPSVCISSCMSHNLNLTTALPSGTWVWWYIVQDEANTEIFGNATSNITRIDTMPPGFTYGPYLNTTANDDLEASWSATDLHSGVFGYLYALDTCDFSNSSVTTSTSVTFVNPSDGSHFICVQVIDEVGNIRTLTSGSSILDTTPPSLMVNNLPSDWITLSSTTVSWNSTDSTGILGVTIDSDMGGQTSGLPANGSHTLTGLVSGFHNITVTATDHYGNSNSSTQLLRVDAILPLVLNLTSENSSHWHHSPLVTLSWDTIEEHSGLAYLSLWLDEVEIGNLQLDAGGIVFEVPDGEHQVEIRVQDIAGNSGSSSILIRIDSAVPVCTLDLGQPHWVSVLPEFDGSVSANGGPSPITWWLTINDQRITEPDLQTFDLLSLADGTNTITLVVANSAGTETTCISTLLLDRLAPSMLALEHEERTGEEFLQASLTAIDDTSGILSLSLIVNGLEVWQSSDHEEGDSEASSNPTIPLPASTYGEGSLLLEWMAEDIAGNILHIQRTVILDRTAPLFNLVRLENSLDGIWVSTSQPQWTWSVYDALDTNIYMTLDIDGVAIIDNASPNWFNRAIPDITMPNGTHLLTISATDSVGNAAQRIVTFGIDTTTPECNAASRQSSGWTSSPTHMIDISASIGPSGGLLRWLDGSTSPPTYPISPGDYQTTVGPVDVVGVQTIEFEIQSNAGKIDICSALLRTDPHEPAITSFSVSSEGGDDSSFGDGRILIQWEVPFENESNSLRSLAVHINGEQAYPLPSNGSEDDSGNQPAELLFANINRNASFISFEHITDQDGDYLVTLTVRDEAGNINTQTHSITVKMDTVHPSMSCFTLSGGEEDRVPLINDDEFVESPLEIACIIDDDSTINLRDTLGSIEMIIIDGSNMTSYISYTSQPEEFKVSIPGEKRGIGHHYLEIRALDRWGKAVHLEMTYVVNGTGAYLLLDGQLVQHEYNLTINWNLSNQKKYFSPFVMFTLNNVNLDGLDESGLSDYFIIGSGNNQASLSTISTFEPPSVPGSSETIQFTVDDGYTQTSYSITLRVEPCPSTHDLVNDKCKEKPLDWINRPHIRGILLGSALVLIALVIFPLVRRTRSQARAHGWLNDQHPYFQEQTRFMDSLIPMLEKTLFSGTDGPAQDWEVFRKFSDSEDSMSPTEMVDFALKHAVGEWERTFRVMDEMDDGLHNESVDSDKVAEITVHILRDGRDLAGALEDLFDDGLLNYSNIGGEEE